MGDPDTQQWDKAVPHRWHQHICRYQPRGWALSAHARHPPHRIAVHYGAIWRCVYLQEPPVKMSHSHSHALQDLRTKSACARECAKVVWGCLSRGQRRLLTRASYELTHGPIQKWAWLARRVWQNNSKHREGGPRKMVRPDRLNRYCAVVSRAHIGAAAAEVSSHS